ncbi:hypothetical protein BDF22DRAFT_742896 [Syncephalis plumigaleata]|nr:hypothetical protein BDF22DRAFT_742896 [Syncephalis plumigaleata]
MRKKHHRGVDWVGELVFWGQLGLALLMLFALFSLPGMPKPFRFIRRIVVGVYRGIALLLQLSGITLLYEPLTALLRGISRLCQPLNLSLVSCYFRDTWDWLIDQVYNQVLSGRYRHAPIRGLINTVYGCLTGYARILNEMKQDNDTSINGNAYNDKSALLVANVLLDTLDAINAPLDGPAAFRPRQLTQSLAQHRRVINREQQDAHEFFQILSDTLTQEAAKVNEQRQVISLLDSNAIQQFINGATLVGSKYQRVRNPFSGLLASRISCVDCGYTGPIRHFSFDNLSLSPPLQFSCSLAYCLEQYIQIETLDDFSCRRCSLVATQRRLAKLIDGLEQSDEMAVKEKARNDLNLVEKALETDVERELPNIKLVRALSRQTTKQVMIAQPPPLLCLHISRSTFSYAGDLRKNGCWVRFPIHLNLAPYCTHGELCLEPKKSISGIDMPIHDDIASDSEDSSSSSIQTIADDMKPTTPLETSSTDNNPSLTSSSSSLSSSPVWYRLRSVVIHYGGHHYGHFVAFRRATLPEELENNEDNADANGEQVPIDDVQNENPYLLIYERDPTFDASEMVASELSAITEKQLKQMNSTVLASLEQKLSLVSDEHLQRLTPSSIIAQ